MNQFGGGKTGCVFLLFCFFSLGVSCDIRAALLWNYHASDDVGNSLFGQLTTGDRELHQLYGRYTYTIQSFDSIGATSADGEFDVDEFFSSTPVPTLVSETAKHFYFDPNDEEIDYGTLMLGNSRVGALGFEQGVSTALQLGLPGIINSFLISSIPGHSSLSFQATTLTITPVPEPEAFVILAAICLLVLPAARRWRGA